MVTKLTLSFCPQFSTHLRVRLNAAEDSKLPVPNYDIMKPKPHFLVYYLSLCTECIWLTEYKFFIFSDSTGEADLSTII